MNAKRLAAVLRAAAARLDPPARPPSIAAATDDLRRELEAEARAEFGLRNIQFDGPNDPHYLPDAASPGDVWPPTTYTRRLKAVK